MILSSTNGEEAGSGRDKRRGPTDRTLWGQRTGAWSPGAGSEATGWIQRQTRSSGGDGVLPGRELITVVTMPLDKYMNATRKRWFYCV